MFGEIKKLWKIVFPLILYQIIFKINGFSVASMTAKLDNMYLAAYGLVWDVFTVSTSFFTGILSSTTILISYNFGARNLSGVTTTFHQGLWVSVLISPILMIILWLSPIILSKTQHDPVLIDTITHVFYVLLLTVLPGHLIIAISKFFMGIQKTYLVTLMGAVIVLVQVFLTHILFLGELGFSKLGLNAVGYAITISYCIALITFLVYLFYSKAFKQYELFKNLLKINLKIIYEIVRLGIPIGFTVIAESGLFAVMAIMMSEISIDTLAAYEISHQYFSLALVIELALLRATTISTGFAAGNNNLQNLRHITYNYIIIGIMLISLFSIIYIFFPEFIIGFIIDDNSDLSHKLIVEASRFLILVGILIPINCIRLIILGALRGLKDVKIPFIIIFISLWCIGIPCAYLLGFTLQLGGIGIWSGVLIGSLLAIIILVTRFNLLLGRTGSSNLVAKL
ncbi:MAG: MATE family efflux transporter [Rickettsiales bacterium]|nr:MATE family efflux transporter [Rickettsiales bacterium]